MCGSNYNISIFIVATESIGTSDKDLKVGDRF